MPRPNYALWLASALFILVPTLVMAASHLVNDSYHLDHRGNLKLQFEPQWNAPAGLTSEALALQFLVEHHTAFDLPADASNLELARVQESLLGKHLVFQQKLNGIVVDKGEIIVSVSKTDGRIYRVFNNSYPVKTPPLAASAIMSEDEAYDVVWRHLRGHGDLLAAPRSELVYTPVGTTFQLNYVVELDLAGPYGGWRHRVDAVTGEILAYEDSRLMRLKTTATEIPVAERLAAYTGPIWDRQQVFARYEQSAREAATAGKAITANGTGVVFDPDPRATLMDDNLQDGSPASAFTDAYFTRDLLDISFSGGSYSLTGPYINITNWDPPSTPPSTTTDGNWTAVRGDNAFNDAMTYFQIDQNQRYMQSLGFTGPTGIQEGPIVTDTDGVNGADNSYYQPGSNRMSFGHGCVDDSEDTDVMLHEYGHAINHDINSSWGGGDMGAIGEGFGDYWAGSYSYATPNGMVYHPEWVFSWDGHGNGNQCWPGRILNAFGAQYNHATFYGAHQFIPGGYQSDELWSTPNFQSLITLMNMGYPREEVDQIILEAQFGLGYGLKMRDMANAIIATAGSLYPGEPHAQVFIDKFLVHNIVESPQAVIELDQVVVSDPSGNGAADPGETVDLTISLVNSGALGAEDITAQLSTSTPLVSIPGGGSSYPALPIGSTAENTTEFTVSIDASFVCGDPIAFQLVVDFSHGGSDPDVTTLNFELGTGVPEGVAAAVNPELSIPDNNPTGVSSVINVTGSGAVVSEGFNVDINLTHTYISDLRVRLISPSGTSIYLHNRTGGSADDIIGNYPDTLTPAQSLSAFWGEPLDGEWTMVVSDHAGLDTGVLHSWGINDISGYNCDTVITALADDGIPAQFSVFQNQPNPFNPATVISFEVPSDAGLVSLEIYDVTGRRVATLHQGSLAPGLHQMTWRGRDDSGRAVSSGVYFYRLQGNNFDVTRKMVMLQ
jgi:subtilisin-like proprotein convertase family protein